MLTIIHTEAVVQVLTDQHRTAGQTVAKSLGSDLEGEVFKTHGIVIGHYPLVLLRKNAVQVGSPVGDKGGSWLLGVHREFSVVRAHPMLLQKSIGSFETGDPTQAQLLHQPPLPGSK